ncbi:MAG: helix-turn-helix transcriptional regulator [Clostridia bacterium]|nr:helix-turn-helix transcriptional regulator [Clostridia bacterium]
MTRGQRIQKLRTDAGMSQETFASLLGVSRQSVSKWEADRAFPEIDKLTVIAEKFGVSCDWIITGEDILIEESEQKNDKKMITIPHSSYIALMITALTSALCMIGMCAYLLYTIL